MINHERYMEALLKYRENVVLRDAEANFEAEKRRWENENMLERSVREIEEDILTLKCPRCRQAFADYDGCAALKCHKPGCNAGFCAFCLADCGHDAHHHITECPELREGNLHVLNGYFVGGWKEHMNVLRKRRVEEYLRRPGIAEHRPTILDKLRVQLDQLEIKID